MFSSSVDVEQYTVPPRNYRVQDDLGAILDDWTEPGEPVLKPDDRVLFVRLSAIGDVIRAVPAIQYLRTNGFTGELHWATHPPCDSLLRHWPGLDEIHTITREDWWLHPQRFYRELSELGEKSFDWVFDFHGLLKSGVVVWSADSPRKVGFHSSDAREGNHLFQTDTIPPLPENSPRILNYLALLRPWTKEFSIQREKLTSPDLPRDNLQDDINDLMKQEPILIHPRTSHGRYGELKEWGVDNFRTLIEDIVSETVDTPIRITWGPGERDTAEAVAAPFAGRVQPAPETPDLLHLCHLIDSSRFLVSGDTAPCHIADILRTPLVALFGGSNYFVSGPFFTNYRLITRREDEGETSEIPVKRVCKAVKDLLRDG